MGSIGLLLALLVSSGSTHSDETISVFAAASLKESFSAAARAFEAEHAGSHVALQFAGSQQLAAQILQGAPCDVFASADETSLSKVDFAPNSRRVFALNRLVVVTPAKRPMIRSLKDLDRQGSLVLAARPVPAGAYARQAMEAAALRFGAAWLRTVQSHVVSEEVDVRSVLAKVELGEADAGIVYATDAVEAKGKVRSYEIPVEFQPRIEYPVATLASSQHERLCREFIKSLLITPGQRIFTSRGFISPLGPRPFFAIAQGSLVRLVKLPLTKSQVWKTVTATGPDKKPHSYTGVPLSSLLGNMRGANLAMEAADQYRESLPFEQVVKSGAVVVPSKSAGNAQLIVPGLLPRYWMDWIVRIEVK